jgi:glycosyltransferase involved in cell wall biosynthesis
MSIALLTPTVVDRPTTGFKLRLAQLQTVLQRIDAVAAWDIGRSEPVDLAQPAQHQPVTAGQLRPNSRVTPVVRDSLALALHIWPRFTVRSLIHQRKRILGWIDRTRPDQALLVHPYATELIPDLCRRGIRVFVDAQNVESDLARQLLQFTTTRAERVAALVKWLTLRRWEAQLFPRAHAIWLPSNLDAERQRRICQGRARIGCVPNALDMTRYELRPRVASHDIVLPASFGYEPNVYGARIFRDQVLPLVRHTVPEARLLLVGVDPSGAARALQRDPDVVATGEVPDTQPYLRGAGVVAVPMFQGGGTRYKILEALALGVPVITTPLGCEGLDVRDGEHLLIRDIDQFACAVTTLLKDQQYGIDLAGRGRALIEQSYSWTQIEKILRCALAMPRCGAVEPV